MKMIMIHSSKDWVYHGPGGQSSVRQNCRDVKAFGTQFKKRPPSRSCRCGPRTSAREARAAGATTRRLGVEPDLIVVCGELVEDEFHEKDEEVHDLLLTE
jgi:hypothetical protein